MAGMRVTFSVAVPLEVATMLDKYSEANSQFSKSEIVSMAIEEFLKDKI